MGTRAKAKAPLQHLQQRQLPVGRDPAAADGNKRWKGRKFVGALRTMMKVLALPSSPCRLPALPGGPSDSPSEGRRVVGTLFGYRKGHVHLAVQESAKAPPLLLLELATPTATLVKEMASGLVRIALECDKVSSKKGKVRLLEEPVWSMYCNGKRTGYAMRKTCSESDQTVLRLVQAVSMGAGVVPLPPSSSTSGDANNEGDMMYMRARFERVVGSRDSEALYMINPDGSGGPELSIFLLRI